VLIVSARVLTARVFASPGTPSSKNVASSEYADEEALYHVILADDASSHLVDDVMHQRGVGCRRRLCAHVGVLQK
jgi:hypothetical protein